MSRKGENIYKRKDGRWEGRYLKSTVDGKSRYGYVYAATYRDVKARLQAAAAQYQSAPTPEATDRLLLSQAAERWERHMARQVKDSTRVKYHTILRKHLLPALGDTPVDELTHERIESHAHSLLESLSPRTVSDVISVLRSILRFARRMGAQVPCDGSSVRIRCRQSDIRVLSLREQRQLSDYLYRQGTHRSAGILLSLYAGLRVGEVCALRWEDVDLTHGVVHIRGTMQRIQTLDPTGPRTRIVVTAPKSTTSARTIPLPEELIRALDALPGPREGYFLTCREDVCTEPRTMQYYFRRTQQHLGLSPANYHALRHTFATRCIELGFDVKTLSELLGHSTVSMTMDRYVHPSLEHKREYMQRLCPLMELCEQTDGESDGEAEKIMENSYRMIKIC